MLSWSFRGVDGNGETLSRVAGSLVGEVPVDELSPRRETLIAFDRLRPGDILSSTGVTARGSLACRIDGCGDAAGLDGTRGPAAVYSDSRVKSVLKESRDTIAEDDCRVFGSVDGSLGVKERRPARDVAFSPMGTSR